MTATSAFAVFDPARLPFANDRAVSAAKQVGQDQLGIDHFDVANRDRSSR